MSFSTTLPLVPYNDHSTLNFHQPPHTWDPDGHWLEPDPYNNLNRPRRSVHIRRLQDDRIRCERNLGWSIEYATAYIVNFLNNSPDASATLKRICTKANQQTRVGGSMEVAFTCFNQLNQCLFADRLKDAVYLMIQPMDHDVSGATYTHGHGPNPNNKRVTISLNTETHQHASGRQIIASLVHHMIHAWFLVACGPQLEAEVEYGRLSHGLAFVKVMRTIKDLAIVNGRPRLLVGPGHPLCPRNHYYDDYHDHDILERLKIEKEDWSKSYCPSQVPGIPIADLDKWYNAACAPLLDLPKPIRENKVFIFNTRNELEKVNRGKTVASNSSYEFLIEKKTKAVLVLKKIFDDYPGIKAKFEKAKTRYMEVKPEKVPMDAFMGLMELFHTGSYSPDIAAVMGEGRLGGPPVIKAVRTGACKEYLAKDVKMWNLGVDLGFGAVREYAMDRLRAQSVCFEDPVELLRLVYKEGEPHPDMRQWVREFLKRSPTADSAYDGALGATAAIGLGVGLGVGVRQGEGGGAATAAGVTLGPPNLWKLQHELCFRERFLDLLDKCGALHIDVLKAEEMLAQEGRTPSPASRALGMLGPYAPPSSALIGATVPAIPAAIPSLSLGGYNLGGMPMAGRGCGGIPLASAPLSLGWPGSGIGAGVGTVVDQYEMARDMEERALAAAQLRILDDWTGY